MDSIIGAFYNKAASQENVLAKALANFLFREIIEDAHSKYGISQEDMKQMCKRVVNRASLYVDKICNSHRMHKAFLIYASHCLSWDEPEITDEIKEELKFLEDIAKKIDE